MSTATRKNGRCRDCVSPGLGGWGRVLSLCTLTLAAGLLYPFAVHAAEAAGSAVRSGCEIDYPPFCIVHEDGRADGFSVELMRAALQEMGREVTFRTGPWAEVRGWLERGEVDALPLVGRTPEREELFDFTVPYLTMRGAIVVREDNDDIHSLADLRGRRVGVMQGDNAEEFLRREERGFEIVTAPTFADSFRDLAEGRCDAVVTQRLVAIRLLEETGLTANLKIVERPIPEFAQDFCFAVKEGDRETLSVLNEGLALAVADGTHRRLHAKWFAQLELPADRPIVVGGDYNYPPFEFLDEKGRPAGFTVELTRAIAREMNMDVRIELGPWGDRVNALREGKIDALEGMFYSAERDRVLDFSPRYLVLHCVSVVRKGDGPPPTTIEELRGRDLVVQAEDAILDALSESGIDARITTVETQEDVVRAVAEGRNACGLATRFGALYAIKKHGWANIEVGDQAFYSGEYGYAVPHGNDALLAQFTEGLRVVKDSGEYQRIYEKWLGVYEPGASFRTAFKYIAIVAGPILLIAVLALLWSWSLQRQVAARTRELRESEQFTRAVLDHLPLGIAVNSVDPAVEFSYMNDRFPRTYRTTREALADRDGFWEAVYKDPEFREVIKKKVLDDCAGGDPERMSWENVPITREGEETSFVSARNVSVPDKDLAISMVWDVTERKRQEERIQHLNLVLRAIRDVNQLITHETDRAALLRRACEILVSTRGYRSAWVALRNVEGNLDDVAECGIGEDFAAVKERLERGEWPECYRRALEQPDGIAPMHDTSVSCKTCALAHGYRDTAALAGRLWHAGRDYGVLVVALPEGMADDEEEQSLFRELVGDVAYALHAMETRREGARNEQILQAIFQSASDGILLADAESGRFILGNEAICRMLGYHAEEIAGLSLADIHPAEALESVRAKFEMQARGEITLAEDIAVIRKDGAVFPADVNSAPFELDGHRHVAGFFRDITARKKIESEREKLQSQLIQAQKMESVGRLAGGVAHDFNNILQVMMGYSQMLLDALPDESETHERAVEIYKGAERAADLTRQLLAFARKQTIAPKVLDLNETIESMLKMLRRLIGEDIDLAWQPAGGLWWVKVDPGQIDQILANLCVNARDAIEGVGKVTIETHNTTFDEAYCADHAGFVPGEFAMLAVSDDGCGMDKETRDKIFEPFFTTKGMNQGTGLGLATVYGIVKQNDGFINVYSEPGQGTTFRIYLPRHDAETPRGEERAETGICEGRGETLLFVEDDAAILRLGERMLASMNYDVHAFGTAGDALEFAGSKEGDIHMLITDVVMPEMSGRDLSNAILRICPDIRVLFMSGYTANVIAHRGVLDEGVNFIQKPFSPRDLAKKVREVLDS